MALAVEGIKEREMDFGFALHKMYGGEAVARDEWKGTSIKLQEPDMKSKMSFPYIYSQTGSGEMTPWIPSQADLLSGDWETVWEGK